MNEILTQATLDADVLASDFSRVVLVSSASVAQVGIAFPNGQEARTLLRVALGLTPTAGETVLA